MAVPISRGSASRDSGTSNVSVASFTPAADAMLVAWVTSNGDPDSISGHDDGNTWAKIATNQSHGSGAVVSVWGCHVGGSPSAGAVTVANSTDTVLSLIVAEIPDIDVSGTVANSILDNDGNTGTSTTASTPALSATSDLTMGYYINTNSNPWTVENTSLISTSWYIANYIRESVDYAENGDTTHTATQGSSEQWAAVALSFRLDTGGGTDDCLADNIESDSEVGTPSVGQEHALNASDVQSTSEVSTPVLSQVHALLANDIQSTTEVSSPSLVSVAGTDNLLANDLQSNSEVTTATVTQIHALLANNIESDSEVTAPAITEVQNLLANNLESASEVTAPALAEIHNLNANDLESSSEATNPNIGQAHQLNANDLQSTSQISSPALVELIGTDALLANDIESASNISTPTIGQIHAILANDAESTSEVTSPSLVELVDELLANNVESQSETSTATLAQVHVLYANNVESQTEVSGTLIDSSKYIWTDSTPASGSWADDTDDSTTWVDDTPATGTWA